MFRSAISNLTLYRSTYSSSVFFVSFSSDSRTNLNRQFYDSKMKYIYDKNDERNDYNSRILYKSNKFMDNLSKNHKLSQSVNPIFSKSNTLLRTSSTYLGARNFSNEAIGHVPLIKLTGIWKSMSESAPVEFCQETLISFHSVTNLPWWATIVLTTFIVRSTFTLPLSLYQHYILAKVSNLTVEMDGIVKNLKAEANLAVSRYGWSEDKVRFMYDQAVKEKWNALIQRDNCHPGKGFIVLWTQIPLWITISTALRNICFMLPASSMNAEKTYLELTSEGFGWVVNLIDVDHYWIIPISLGIVNLMNVEIMSLMKIQQETKLQKYLIYFVRFISVGMVPLAAFVPACISLYWLSSSTFGLLQNLALLSPKIRRLGGVPLTSHERANPYRHLIAQIKAKRYLNFFRKS